MPNRYDCTYVGLDASTNTYHVHQQLYPEARGFIVHEFPSEEAALTWLEALLRDDRTSP